MLPQSISQFRGLLETTRLFQGGVTPARAGALKGFVFSITGPSHLPGVPSEVIDEAKDRAGIREKDLEFLRQNFESLFQGKIRRPKTSLTKADKSCFNETLLKAMHLPWNAQSAGALLVFAGQSDEEIPTAASGFFPDYESFRSQSIEWASQYTRGTIRSHHNNFYMYFCDIPGSDYRSLKKPFYSRFLREEPGLERRLTKRITADALPRNEKSPGDYLPAVERELYEAYKKMASYVEEVRAKENPDWPWRVLIA